MILKTKKGKILAIIIIAIICAIGFLVLVVSNFVEKEKTTDIREYEQYMGDKGKHSGITLIESDIFPDSIPKSANVESFMYDYYNPWDPCFLVYLVYTCNDEDYEKEMKRLEAIPSSTDYAVYGTTEFPYELCAVNADEYYGIIYAMTEESENKIVYVEITACNYFSDIDYEKLIDKQYLPYGFDMSQNNLTRKNQMK
jgi:hypothetical protein